jgi:Mg-chelatase subunit ChlD/anti-sigma factor RsiW
LNPESPTPREQLEARLTALLLGELSPDEAAALREIISNDAQLAALHDRLKRTIELVRETAADPAELSAEPPAPRRLGEERRQKLLAQFKTVTPREFARPRPSRSPQRFLLEMAAVIAVVICLSGLLLPSLARTKAKAQRASTLASIREEEFARKLSREELSELQRQKPDEAASQPLAAPEAPLMPAPTGPATPENGTPKQETIILPSTVETVEVAGAANPGDIKPGDNYGLNPPVQVEAAKKKLPVENKDTRPVQDLAQLSSGLQDNLKGVDDLRLRERIVKEKETVVETPVALGVDKTAVGFDESNMQGLRAPIEGRDVVTGVAGHGATGLADLNQRGANGQTAASTPPPFIAGGASVVTFQNSASAVAIGGSSGEGRGGSAGGGGGGFGGAGVRTGQPGTPNTGNGTPSEVLMSLDGDGIAKPGPNNERFFYRAKENPPTATESAAKLAVSPRQRTGGSPVPRLPAPALVSARPAPISGVSSIDNSGALAVTTSASASTSSVTDEAKQRQVIPVRTLNPVIITNTETQDAGRFFLDLNQSTTANRSPNTLERNALATRAQTVQQNVADSSVDLGAAAFTIGGATVATNSIASEDRPLAKSFAPPSKPQAEVQVSENAFSTFSLNVSDVSFKLAAASLERGVMPDAGSVRSEEFINAFDYRDPAPAPGAPIGFAWERAHYPFAHNRDLLRFSVKAAAAGRQPGRPLNLVLLLDNSGSMERADRVAIIHEALRVLAAQLQSQDTISVVTFARTARLWVDGIPGTQAGQVLETVGSLTPEGGTDLGDALDLAYATAHRHYLMNGVNRVVLLTDGAANLGNVDPGALKKNVEAQRKQGIDLDCFGIGWEGYNDDLLEVLTRNGDGRYGFINTPEEAASGFAAQLAGALRVAASDVKVQVEFNPARVISYRQIGYAKHQLTKEQFRDNTVAAAQIGAAESGNALYTVEVNPQGTGPVCTVHVRYRDPGTADYFEHAWDVPYTGNAVALEQASPAMRLAATASAFSEWLASSPFAADVSSDALLGYLRGVPEVYGADTRPAQLETMIREAKSLTGK